MTSRNVASCQLFTIFFQFTCKLLLCWWFDRAQPCTFHNFCQDQEPILHRSHFHLILLLLLQLSLWSLPFCARLQAQISVDWNWQTMLIKYFSNDYNYMVLNKNKIELISFYISLVVEYWLALSLSYKILKYKVWFRWVMSWFKDQTDLILNIKFLNSVIFTNTK